MIHIELTEDDMKALNYEMLQFALGRQSDMWYNIYAYGVVSSLLVRQRLYLSPMSRQKFGIFEISLDRHDTHKTPKLLL